MDLDFEKWFQGEQGNPYGGMYMFALAAWNARQPEIDALKEEVERLKVKIKLMSTPDAEMKERK